nr:hypothetical protein [Klebsiella grimontii]
MRRSVIIPVTLHTLAAVATLLWLLWYFIPTGNVFKGLTTLLILLLAGWYVFKSCRREEQASDATLPAAELPLLDTHAGARNVDSLLNQQILPVLSQQLLSHMAAKQKPHSVMLSWDEEEGIVLEFGIERS